MPRRLVNLRFYKELLYEPRFTGVGKTFRASKRTPAELTKREIEELYNFSVGPVPGRRNLDGKEYAALLERLNIDFNDAYWITKHKYRPEVTVPLARKYFPNQFPGPRSRPDPTTHRPIRRFGNALKNVAGSLLQEGPATCRTLFQLRRGPSSQR